MNYLDIIITNAEQKIGFLDENIANTTKPLETDHRFLKSISKDGLSFICELKKASPSKGMITHTLDHVAVAKDFEKAHVDAISVLTESSAFLGLPHYLDIVRKAVETPILRKDFIIDEKQIYHTAALRADGLLLIVSILDPKKLQAFIELSNSLGIDNLVECHDEKEIEIALNAGAKIIGINNRNLRTFNVNMKNAEELRTYVPDGIITVAESGIQTREDVIAVEDANFDAVLIGEVLMRSHRVVHDINQLRGTKQSDFS
jgi:indole-3-glycerol phosphate synthase